MMIVIIMVMAMMIMTTTTIIINNNNNDNDGDDDDEDDEEDDRRRRWKRNQHLRHHHHHRRRHIIVIVVVISISINLVNHKPHFFHFLPSSLAYTARAQNESELTISIHLVDHVLQLGLRWILSKRPHHRAQFFGGDGAVTILVEQWERLFELCTKKEGNIVFTTPNFSSFTQNWALGLVCCNTILSVQSSQLAEPLWTDPGLKKWNLCARADLNSKKKKKRGGEGADGEWISKNLRPSPVPRKRQKKKKQQKSHHHHSVCLLLCLTSLSEDSSIIIALWLPYLST